MPNDWLLRNSSHDCHCDVVGRATRTAKHAGDERSGTAAGGARTARGSARRRGARWPGSGSATSRSAIDQVDAGEHGERAEEQREQRQLGADHAPEHVGLAEAVVPQEVDVEAGDGAAEDHDDDEEQDAGR